MLNENRKIYLLCGIGLLIGMSTKFMPSVVYYIILCLAILLPLYQCIMLKDKGKKHEQFFLPLTMFIISGLMLLGARLAETHLANWFISDDLIQSIRFSVFFTIVVILILMQPRFRRLFKYISK